MLDDFDPCRFTLGFVLAAVCLAVVAVPAARGPLRPDAEALAAASAELVDTLRAEPFNYFRFINRPWIARVCEAFAADLHDVPIVQLHGDAHVEQYAFTKDAWGLDDFDDSARGPAIVDVVRFLGSIDLAVRQRGWIQHRDALWNRFLAGYRRGLSEPDYHAPQPGIVRRMRAETPATPAAFYAWAEQQMRPMEDASMKTLVAGTEKFARFMHVQRPELAPGFFLISRAGWLQIGVGSALARKMLIRVQGPSPDPDDDEFLEVKEITSLDGLLCLEDPPPRPALRVIAGTTQLGRLKHHIVAVGPEMPVLDTADASEHPRDWVVRSWEPSYREVRLADYRSVNDLAAVVYDSGVQLGAGRFQSELTSLDVPARRQVAASLARLDGRIRRETSTLVEELLAGWRELRGR